MSATLSQPSAAAHTIEPKPAPAKFDAAAIARHGIGRGDFAALVFSGSTAALGETIGMPTWSTARRFALPDPRLTDTDDLARSGACPFAHWPESSPRPTPGVCFIFTDESHPGVASMREQGGIEFEQYVVLSTLTLDRLLCSRLEEVIRWGAERPIALLGFGDQGERIANVLLGAGVRASRIFVADDRPMRAAIASSRGMSIARLDDPRLASAAIISSPLTRPPAFEPTLAAAIRDGRPIIDQSATWDDRAEFAAQGNIHLTAAAHRAFVIDKHTLSARQHGLNLTASIARLDHRRIGRHIVPHLHGGHRLPIGPGGTDLAHSAATDRLPAFFDRAESCFVGLDGQSNQHDAALGLFAARSTFADRWPSQVRSLIPAEHRAALGSTRFERLLANSITGRTMGAPYLTAIEQAAISILARVFAHDAPIVEIGSALGGSALLMAAATERRITPDSPDSGPPIFSIDPDEATRPAMRTLFEHEGFAQRLTMLVKTSDAVIVDLAHLTNRVGLIFIDGLHTREQSARDARNFAPLVRPGGVLLFHDFDARFAGVAATIVEFASDPRFQPLLIADTIAVFQRKANP